MKLRFHGEHIGSLLRPQYLVDAKASAKKNEISAAELEATEHKAISSIVQTQVKEGIYSICSGEFDRDTYFSGFFEKLQGFKAVEDPPWELYRMSAPPIRALRDAGLKFPLTVVCTGKIKHEKSTYLEQWKYLRSCVPKEQWGDCKFTMPPAPFFHLRLAPGKCYPKDVYANDEEYFADLALAYRAEFKALYDEGLRSIQIDDPTLAYFCSQDMIDGLEDAGVNSDALFDQYLKAHNECLKGRPADLEIALHICRGNFSKSVHFSEGSYERIARKLFNKLDYSTFYLEYDSPRAGGFEPLRFLPKDKNVVLGVVSTKIPELEDPEEIKRKIHEAAEIIAQGQNRTVKEVMPQIGISPQCGFASVGVGGQGFDEGVMLSKLRLVRDVSREIWG